MNDEAGTNRERIEKLSVLKQIIKIPERAESKSKEITTVYSLPILFMIAAILFVGGLTSGACNAASGPQEVHVGSELDFPPYALVDENGQPTGFSVELIKAVTATMGLSVKVSSGSWDTVWNSLLSGQLDMLPIVAKTPERQHLVDFSLPHTETYDAFFMRKGDTIIPNIAAAQGKEIVVMRSDAAHHQLMERNFQGKLILVDTIPAGLKLILSGKHNAMLCSKLIGTMSIKEQGITGLTGGPTIPDYKRTFSFAVKKGNTELLEKLNQGLLIVKTNGEYDRIYDKWLSFDDPWRRVQKYLLPTMITVIVLALIAGFWLMTLRRLVNKRTRELAEINKILHHAYDDMEARVQERTAELAQSNQSLQTEITEHKRVEEALQESEKKLRATLDATPFPTAVVDLQDDKIFFWSQRAITLFGHDVSTTDDWYQLAYPDPDYRREVIERWNFFLEIAHESGQPINTGEYRVTCKDGSVRICELYATFLPDNLLVTFNDITERKQVEKAMQENEERFRLLFENMTSGSAVYTVINDGSNGADYIIKSFNKTSLKIEGKTLEDVVGKSLSDLRPNIDNYGLIPVLKKVWQTGETAFFPTKIYQDEHFSNYYENHIFKIPSGEVVTIYNDVTDRKLAEEKIKSSLLEKETMLKEIHHRVKNNLQVISSLLNMQSSYLQDEKAKEIFQNSMDRVSTMAKIHTLLYQSEDLTRIDFDGFIRDLAGRLQQAYGIAGRPVGIHVNASDVSLTMEASIPCGLILNELVANTLKHAFPEGKGGEVNISMATAGDQLVLKVQDNGIGFPEAVDFQNTKSLGLELVNLLVGQMNGAITLTVEGGTTFTITFPAVSNGG